jgi:hypothetical protein
MKNYILKFLKEYWQELLIGLIFVSAFYLYLLNINLYKTNTKIDSTYIQNGILLFTVFIAWIQFLFYKFNKKKEAAITYFPKPLELQQLENDIDEIINFWSSNDPLDINVVNLMLGKYVSNDEYKIIWDKKLSIGVKERIVNRFDNKTFEYKPKYNDWIKQEFLNVRRKLNAYLNQIEGYCSAVNEGNISSSAAKKLFEHKFKSHYKKAWHYIEAVRKEKGDDGLYIEFEKVVNSWRVL